MEKREIRLWLDDVRDPIYFGYIGWTWVKTYEDAVAVLETGDVIEASLDHDLGNEKTGYHVVCWMEENNVYPREGAHVHSVNPVGATRMRKVLEKMRRENA